MTGLYALDHVGPLGFELGGVGGVCLFLALGDDKPCFDPWGNWLALVVAPSQQPIQADQPTARESGDTYVLEAIALVVLQQPVLAAEVAVAEGTVAGYPLGGVPAVLHGALGPSGGHLGW